VLVLIAASALASCAAEDPNHLRGGSAAADDTDPTESAVKTGDTKGATTGGDTTDTCVSTINDYRSKVGLPAYKRWTGEETCASGQAQSDSKTGTGHGAFGHCGELAQDECPAFPFAPSRALPECLAAMWKEGPGGPHYQNMTSTQYTKVACGVFVTATGQTWAVQDFR
jgi:hypothetical protein